MVIATNDLSSGEENLLTENDREVMVDILRRLIHEVEMSVRRRLAERFAELPDSPLDLIVVLAIAIPVAGAIHSVGSGQWRLIQNGENGAAHLAFSRR